MSLDKVFLKRPDINVPTDTLGVGGTAVFGGYIVTNETNAELSGNKKYKTFSQILANTTIVAAGTRYFLNLVAKSEWRVEAPTDDPEAIRLADLVEEILYDMETSWHRVVRRAALYRFFGFSIQEWTAKRRPDGTIGFADVESRPQFTIEKWDVDRTGTVTQVSQRSPQDGQLIPLPRQKLVYIVDDSISDNPEGIGLFRHLVEASRRLERYEKLEGIGFETDLQGIPVARAPIEALAQLVKENRLSKADKDSIEKPLRDFISNHIRSNKSGLLLDSSTYESKGDMSSPTTVKRWDVELLKAQSTSQQAVAQAIERVNMEIARLLGVEQLLLGNRGRGSLALSKDKTENLFMVVDSTLKEIGEAFNKDLLTPLWAMNGWDPKHKPVLKSESAQFKDVQAITAALRDLALSGAPVAPGDPAVNAVRDLVGLPRALQAVIDELDDVDLAEDDAADNDLHPEPGIN